VEHNPANLAKLGDKDKLLVTIEAEARQSPAR